MNWKKIIGWVLAAAVVVGVVAFNMHQQQVLQNTGKRNVYVVLPLTGVQAQHGKDVKKIMEIYHKEKNHDFNLIYIDSESSPSKAISAIEQATLNEKNPIVISAVTAISTALAPIVERKNGFLFAIATVSMDTKAKSFLKFSGSVKDIMTPLIDYLNKNVKTVSIAYIDDEYGLQELRLLQKKLSNVEIKKEVPIPAQTMDIRIETLSLMSSNPEAILILGIPTAGYMNLIKELKIQGYKGKISPDTSLSLTHILKRVGEDSEGLVIPVMDLMLEKKQSDNVVLLKKKLQENNLVLYHTLILSLDVLDLIQYTLKNNLPFSQDTYAEMGKWQGFSGEIPMYPHGDVEIPYQLGIIKNGKFYPVTE